MREGPVAVEDGRSFSRELAETSDFTEVALGCG